MTLLVREDGPAEAKEPHWLSGGHFPSPAAPGFALMVKTPRQPWAGRHLLAFKEGMSAKHWPCRFGGEKSISPRGSAG